MKITRYFQSCLLIEEGPARILIDPSSHEANDIGKFGRLDAVLFTHEHGDHFDAGLAQTFVEEGIAPVYANESTAKLISASKTVVKDGDKFKINDVEVKVYELPHCLLPDGSEGPQNTGFLISGKFFHPGDGVSLEGLKVENLALPIVGPDVSLKDAFDFVKQLEAKKVIPIHYDFLGMHAEMFSYFAGIFNFPVAATVLENGESTEI